MYKYVNRIPKCETPQLVDKVNTYLHKMNILCWKLFQFVSLIVLFQYSWIHLEKFAKHKIYS